MQNKYQPCKILGGINKEKLKRLMDLKLQQIKNTQIKQGEKQWENGQIPRTSGKRALECIHMELQSQKPERPNAHSLVTGWTEHRISVQGTQHSNTKE